MAPPPSTAVAPAVHPVLREVTEDTPPDLLEGTMDLLVLLPNKKTVRVTVSRRTPMMDLLIQVATSNKIVPGGHIVQVRNERGFELPYKPSTPIGALDTTTIEIVPKNQVNDYLIVKKQTAKIAPQPFEHTFRLQVHLPRNQLYVMRVGPKAVLADILQEVCQEKNLDYAKYEMRHPVKLDEKLPLDRRIGDFGLQELTVVSRNSRINSSVSTADIMALQNQNEASRSKGGLDSAFKHSRSSVGDSSVSSESAASARGISPSRSDDSRSISPLPPLRPKLKLTNTMSNASSSSGTSSALPKTTSHHHLQQQQKSDDHPHQMNVIRSSTSLSNIITAPPRTKKRAAPQPPSLVSNNSTNPNNNNNSNSTSSNNYVNVQTKNGVNVSLPPQSPLNNNNTNTVNNSNSNSINKEVITTTVLAPTPPIRPTPRKKDPPKEPPVGAVPALKTAILPPPITTAVHHSRQSSDSSGYHEACVMCDQQDSHVHHHSHSHRFDRQQSVPAINNLSSHPRIITSSLSVSNLTTVPSISSTSLASSNGGRAKRKAPKPPVAPILQAQKEIEEDLNSSQNLNSSSTSSNSNSNSTSSPTSGSDTITVSRSGSESSSSVISQADPKTVVVAAASPAVEPSPPPKNSQGPPPTSSTATAAVITTNGASKNRYRKSSVSVEEVEVEVDVHEESPVRHSEVTEEPLEKEQKIDLPSEKLKPVKRKSEQEEIEEALASIQSSFESTLSNSESTTDSQNDSSISTASSSPDQGQSSAQSPTTVTTPTTSDQSSQNSVEELKTQVLDPEIKKEKDYASSDRVDVTSSDPEEPSNSSNAAPGPGPVVSPSVPVVADEKMSRQSPDPVAPLDEDGHPSRTLNNAQAALNSNSSAQPQPQPPRPRRPRSVHVIKADEVAIDSPLEANALSPPKPKPRPRSVGPPSSDSRNNAPVVPVAASVATPTSTTSSSSKKIGVKVFPDNALPARLARLSKQQQEELHETLPDTSKYKKKSDDPNPNSTLGSLTSGATPKPRQRPPSTDSSTQSAINEGQKTTNNSSSIGNQGQQNHPPRQGQGQQGVDEGLSADSETSSDSDNLEENLELFELSQKKRRRQKRPAPRPPLNSDNKIRSSNGSSSNRRSNGPIKSAEETSYANPLNNGPITSSSQKFSHTNQENSDNVFLSRTMSDRRHQQHLHPVHHDRSSDKGQSLNRWQNTESLDDVGQTISSSNKSNFGDLHLQSKQKQHKPIKKANSNTSSTSYGSGSGGSISSGVVQTRRKISVASDLLQLDDYELDGEVDESVDVHTHEAPDDTTLISSESEISYTDSGVPATETITPSPIDVDLGHLDNDKGISSGGSSRRSSIHSMDDGHDNDNRKELREILQGKIQKEQEIIDKAFEGIEVAADEDEEMDVDATVNNNNHKNNNSNFDFAQTSSMAHLVSTSATSSPHPTTDHQTTDDEREDEGDTSSNDDEEKELKFSSGEDSTALAAHPSLEKSSGPQGIIVNNHQSSNNTNNNNSNRKIISKSESFSHKSEFDPVKMKRKMFSKEGKSSAVLRKSYVSSSDEDLSHAASGAGSGNRGKLIGGGGSMQNLSSVSNNNNKNNSSANNNKNSGHGSAANVSVSGSRRKGPSSSSVQQNQNQNSAQFQKSTSVMNMEDIDPDIAQNPALMESFKNELEAQFEQWKEQFMQKHLGGSKSGSLDNSSSTASASESRKSSNADQVDGTAVLRSPHQSETPNKTSSSSAEIEAKQQSTSTKAVDGTNNLKTIDSSSREAKIVTAAAAAAGTAAVDAKPISEEKICQKASAEASAAAEKSFEDLRRTKEAQSVEDLSIDSSENRKDVQTESFDPEKPQIIHSVKSTSTTRKGDGPPLNQNQQRPEDTEDSYLEPEIISQTQVFTETVAVPVKPQLGETASSREESSIDQQTHSMPVSKGHESQAEEMEPPVQRREKAEEQPKIYRYTGPPTISMGTWGERPQRSVSVKRDRDYIMGMGTHDPKSTEVKPAIGSVATRVHSFLGAPVVTPAPISSTSSNAVASRPKSFYASIPEGSSTNGGPSSTSSSTSNSNASTIDRKVVASWKQRLEESEKERMSFQKLKTPQSSIDIFEPQKEESRITLQAQPSPAPASIPTPAATPAPTPIVVAASVSISTNNSTSNTLERPVKKLTSAVSLESNNNSTNNNNNSSPPPLKISTATYGESRKINHLTFSSSFDGHHHDLNNGSSIVKRSAASEDNTDSASDYSGSSNSRPTSSLSRAPSNASNNSNIVITSMTPDPMGSLASQSSSPTPNNSGVGGALAERKKFFQGIKPAESSAKETPIPAQNLKGNIATIQRVFQQRQQQPPSLTQQPMSLKFNGSSNNSSGSSVASSTASSSPWTSKESSPAPSLVINNTSHVTSFSGPSSSTMMVQKVMKAGSFNVDAYRRTPSPSTSSISSMSTSSKTGSEDRETPSPVTETVKATPVAVPAPTPVVSTNNRFSMGSYEKRPQPQATEDKVDGASIKNVGNKSIIIVGSSDGAPSNNTTFNNNTTVSNNIFKQQLKISPQQPSQNTMRSPAPGKVNLNGAYSSNPNLNASPDSDQQSRANANKQDALIKRQSTPAMVTIQSSQGPATDLPVTTNKVSSIAANLKSNNSGFFSTLSLQRQQLKKGNSFDAPTTTTTSKPETQSKNGRDSDKPVIIEQLEKTRKISANSNFSTNNSFNSSASSNYSGSSSKGAMSRANSSNSINSVASSNSSSTANVPPPPPMMMNIKDGVKLRPVSLGGERPKSLTMSNSTAPSARGVTSPTSPLGNADPRSNIMEAIKNSNGKFGLKKTGSTILLN